MLESIKPYLWIAELVLVAILALCCVMGGYSYAHKDVAIVQGKLDTANGLIAQRDKALADYAKSTADAQAEEAAAKKRQAKAEQDLTDFKKNNVIKDKTFTDNTIKIVKQPECAVLKERLCPAAMDY